MSDMDETIPTGDAVATRSSVNSRDVDVNWTCDYDGAKLHTIARRDFNDVAHEVRECSVNPNHTKIVPA